MDLQTVLDLLYIPGTPSEPGGSGMPDAKYLKWQARLIHLFVAKFLVPTKSSHAYVNHISAWVVYHVLLHNKVNMMQVMGYWMLNKAYTTEGSLPYGMVICHLLALKGITLEDFDSSQVQKISVGFGRQNLHNMPLKKKGTFWYWDDFQVTGPTPDFDL